jgi:hypothetical protein
MPPHVAIINPEQIALALHNTSASPHTRACRSSNLVPFDDVRIRAAAHSMAPLSRLSGPAVRDRIAMVASALPWWFLPFDVFFAFLADGHDTCAGFKSLADVCADTTTPHGRLIMMLRVLGGSPSSSANLSGLVLARGVAPKPPASTWGARPS